MTSTSAPAPIRAFWWSPRRDKRLAIRELRRSGSAWLGLAIATRQPLINFGDEISPLAIEYATHRRVQWAPADSADVVSVGSILEFVARRSTHAPVVWGSGVRDTMSPEQAQAVREAFTEYLAVRGEGTKRVLGLGADTATGDPGVLAPELLGKRPARRSGLLYLPHFRTWLSPTGRAMLRRARDSSFAIAPPAIGAIEMFSKIAAADMVFSSSLHGVIVANALGIPVQLVSIPTAGSGEPNFKYRDYLETVGSQMEHVSPSEMFDATSRAKLAELRENEVAPIQAKTGQLAERLVRAAERLG